MILERTVQYMRAKTSIKLGIWHLVFRHFFLPSVPSVLHPLCSLCNSPSPNRDQRSHMNLQSLVVIALRILALKFLVDIVVTFLPQLYLYRDSFGATPVSNPITFVYVLFIAALVAGALMLWSLALPLARRISCGLPLELSFGALSRPDCYSVAFIGVGVWLISVHFVQTLNWAHYLFRLAATDRRPEEGAFSQINGYDISAAVVPFIVGIILFLNGRKWAQRLAERDERIEKLEALKSEVEP